MTAVLSEGKTESRPHNPCATEVTSKGENDVGPSAERDGLKGGRRNEAKDIDGSPGELEVRPGDGKSGRNFKGTGGLTTGFSNSLNGRSRSFERDHGAAFEGKNHSQQDHLPDTGEGNLQVMSSEGDRDDETEDDFEGASAEGASQPHLQRCRGHYQNAPANESQQTPPQAPAVPGGWESFLPQKNIRVLLAEDDDSTRQVVGALLRNCGYEVSSVANGMQAWEMLEDPKNHFDLVLTDVVMPCLSGVGLLSKIMSDEAGRRIPVIMMSSHDSLDIVFRCLSKGAADFLVKPVRKNELKNLWQHVWRCQSLSGSGSGGNDSGSGNGKVGRAKSRVGSGKNTGSNDGSDDNSSGLNVRGGSDNGSGTQAVVHLTHKLKRDQADAEEGQATSLEKLSNQQMGQDLEMATRRPATNEMERIREDKEREGGEAIQEDSPSTSGNKMEDKGYESGAANSGGSCAKAIDLIGGIAFQNKADADDGVESGDGGDGSDRGASNSPVNDKCVTSSHSPPTLELSLKRPREDIPGGEDRRVLRHSGGSAFSRYSTTGTTKQLPSGTPLSLGGYPMAGPYGSHSLSPGSLGPNITGQLQFSLPMDRVGSSKGSGETSNPSLHPRISLKGNGQDKGSSMVGSSTPDGFSQQVKDEAASASGQGLPISIPLPPRGVMYEGVPAGYGGMHQVFYSHSAAPPWVSGATHVSDRGEVFNHPPFHEHGSRHPHHHLQHHQHVTHHHSRQPQPSAQSQQDEQVVTTQGPGAPRCVSSNMAGSMPDGNGGQSGSSNGYGSTGNGNGSVNGSGSGSNTLSNQNGQSCVAPNPVQTADGGNNNGNAGPNGAVVDYENNRFARREAALNKFRQKRKERCFEKKVRYQSRKRLAEQRPRVRGQFVRQAVYDSNTGGEMAD